MKTLLVDNESFKVNDFLKITGKYGFRSFEYNKTLNEWVEYFGME